MALSVLLLTLSAAIAVGGASTACVNVHHKIMSSELHALLVPNINYAGGVFEHFEVTKESQSESHDDNRHHSLFYITETCPYDLEITCLTLVIVIDIGLHFLRV